MVKNINKTISEDDCNIVLTLVEYIIRLYEDSEHPVFIKILMLLMKFLKKSIWDIVIYKGT